MEPSDESTGRAHPVTPSPTESPPLASDRWLLLLQELAGNGQLLSPERSLESSCGYRHSLAQTILGTRPGVELEHLDHLADLGLLERLFFEKVRLCPFCRHFAVTGRDACPHCESSNLGVVEMIHHYRCGHVGPEPEFENGTEYVCPKCRRVLRHIGVDYERPGSSHACGACRAVFLEPRRGFLCLACGDAFEADRALTRTVHTYRLTSRGVLAAAKGTIDTTGLAGGFIDPDLGVYTAEFFEDRLTQEISRARRYERSLSIALASLDGAAGSAGAEKTSPLFRTFAQTIRENVRDCDMTAFYGRGMLALLLPDTPLSGAQVAAERLLSKLRELEPPEGEPGVAPSFGLADLSEEAGTVAQLMAAATESLLRAQRDGGDRVLSGSG